MRITNKKRFIYIMIIISFLAASLGSNVNSVVYAQTDTPENPTGMPEGQDTDEPGVEETATTEITATAEPTLTPEPTITPEPTATPDPTETPNTAVPNLAAYTPEGWSAPLVISNVPDTSEASELHINESSYIDFALINLGGDIQTAFAISLQLDGQELQRWTVGSLLGGQTYIQNDWQFTLPSNTGAHQLSLIVDVDNTVLEDNESDNRATLDVELLETEEPNPEDTPIFGDLLIAPDIPMEIQNSSGSSAPGIYNTSEYMIGSVAVGIIFPESTGSAENWSAARRDAVIAEIQAGLNWWAQQASASGVQLSFVYEIQYPVSTTYEPISLSSSDEELWITQVMNNMGYTGTSRFTQTRNYINTLRTQKGANWAFAIFVVDSLNDTDGKFSNGSFAYAYLGGPYMVMTYDNNGWGTNRMDQVTAHEVGHIFRAGDNYSGSSGCTNTTDLYGYLGIPNSNCEYNNPGAQTNVLMNNNSLNLHWTTAQQVGWRDSDSDGRMDPVDTTPSINMSAYAPDPTTHTQLTYVGYAYDQPYPHHTYLNVQDVTINKIASVQYRINGGAWNNAVPTDGFFNLDYEQFTFTTPVLSNGTYTIEVIATNTLGQTNPTYWSDTVTVESTTINPPGVFAKTAPANVSVGQSTNPVLTWGASSNVTAYEVCYDTTNDNACSAWVPNGTSTTKTLTGLSLNTKYYWQVRAVNGAGTTYANGSTTAFWSFTTVNADIHEPDDTSTQATLITSGVKQTHSINPVDDEDWVMFVVEGSVAVTIETSGLTSADTRLWLYDSNMNELQFDDNSGSGNYSSISVTCGESALPAGTYYVKVDENGQNNLISEYGLTFTVTQSCSSIPLPPSGLTVRSSTVNSIGISWVDNSINEAGFKIYRWGLVGGNWDFYYYASVDANVASYTDKDLNCNAKYYYKVSAFNDAGESSQTPFVVETTDDCSLCYSLKTGVSPANKGKVQVVTQPDCEGGKYSLGTMVELTASPITGFSFFGWSGDISDTNARVGVEIDGNKNITANFVGIPSIPAPSSPSKGSLQRSYSPLLKWNATLTYLDHYQLQLALDSSFANIVYEADSLTTANHQISVALNANTRYYWRVRSINVLGDTRGWSTVTNFRTALDIPILVSPSSGWSAENPRPSFDWQDVEGATSYSIQISYNTKFSSIAQSKTVTASEYTALTDLARNKVFYWRVRANGTNGPSSWSETWQFTSAIPASTPSLQSPANNSLITSYTPRLDWSNSKVYTGTTFDRYELQIALDAIFSNGLQEIQVYGGVTNSEYTFDDYLIPNAKYYWRVRAYNVSGHYSTWSAVRTFRSAMLPPVLQSTEEGWASIIIQQSPTPEVGWLALSPRPSFDWQDVQGATSYTIQISYNTKFSSIAQSKTVTASEYTALTDLARNKVFFWRVRANGTNGPSLWSEAQQFTSSLAPGTSALLSPSNNLRLKTLTPRLDWANSKVFTGTVFEKYELQIALDSSFNTGLAIFEIAGSNINSEYTFLTPLSLNTRYYWRIRAYNTDGQYSTWSGVRNFLTPLY